jgi:hypothetical protein
VWLKHSHCEHEALSSNPSSPREGKTVFSTNDTVRQLDILVQKNETEPFSHSIYENYCKITAKWTIDLTVRAKTEKLLGENTRENLCDLCLGND